MTPVPGDLFVFTECESGRQVYEYATIIPVPGRTSVHIGGFHLLISFTNFHFTFISENGKYCVCKHDDLRWYASPEQKFAVLLRKIVTQ